MRHVFDAIYNKVVIAFIITAVDHIIITAAPYMISKSTVGYLRALLALLVILTAIMQVFLITPYYIAVHRFIILGEVTTNYQLTPGEPRFLHFFGWLLVISALGVVLLVPQLISTVFDPAIRAVLLIVNLIVVAVVVLRVIILFPAVAVDAPGASWSRAMADTRGYTWRIFFIVLLATLPLVFVSQIVGRSLAAPLLTVQVALAIFNGAIRVISLTLVVVIASRLYERLGDRVKQPV
jgi:hypothetical protein